MMKIIEMGDRVVVIARSRKYQSECQLMPPIGATGEVISHIDEWGEYDIMFDEYPCPVVLPDKSWVIHRNLIALIDGPVIQKQIEAEQGEGKPLEKTNAVT